MKIKPGTKNFVSQKMIKGMIVIFSGLISES